MSGRRQDAGERKKNVPDVTPIQCCIQIRVLRFKGPMYQMHRMHRTQDRIFADVIGISGLPRILSISRYFVLTFITHLFSFFCFLGENICDDKIYIKSFSINRR